MEKYEDLQEKLGYRFSDVNLLIQSLTHSSYINEKGLNRSAGNERLEFLGDSLLGLAVTELLYSHTPVLSEGEMSKIRARIVCEQSLSTQALELDIGLHLILGRGEDIGGGRTRPSILADAFEAVIAAIYLDGGIKPVRDFVTKIFAASMSKPVGSEIDYKTLLQEYVQTKPNSTLTYKIIKQEGPDHNKLFTAQVMINKKPNGTGCGKNKKAAEQAAAKKALETLKKTKGE